MAEFVFRTMVDQRGLAVAIEVDSAGIGEWHIGERVDRRAVTALSRRGYDDAGHRARQFEPAWFAQRDLVIALDRGHQRVLRSWAPTEQARAKIHLLRSFDPAIGPDAQGSDLDVPDPYYDGAQAFTEVLAQVEAACAGLLDWVVAQRGLVGGRRDQATG
jgi:protein-tyrosine phosphatase